MSGSTENTVAVLRAAKDILRTRGWTKHAYARNKDGEKISAGSEDAVSFCALGALGRAQQESSSETYPTSFRFMEKAAIELSHLSAAGYNDLVTTTIEDIYRLFDRAIELAETKNVAS